MKELDQKLRQHYKVEADKFIFDSLHFETRLKSKVLKTVNSRKRFGFVGWMASGRKKLAYGTVAVAMVVMFAVALPMLQNMLGPAPIDNTGGNLPAPNIGNEGTSLSTLKTVILQTPEEAKQQFGPNLLVPSYIPEGYQQTEIQATGTEENIATQVVFTYTSGEKVFTLMENKKATSHNFDPFDPIEVNGNDGYVIAAPGITELYWNADGIQFSIIGPLSKDEAIKVAESLGLI